MAKKMALFTQNTAVYEKGSQNYCMSYFSPKLGKIA
jgi:hypothetical protein